MIGLRPILIGQPTEHDEERRGEDDRRPDHEVGVQVAEAQDVLHEEQRLELALVPHDSLTGGHAQQREQDQLAIGRVAEALAPRRGRRLALGLEPREQRRFLKAQTDDEREHDQDGRQDEGDAPAVLTEGRITHRHPEDRDDGQGQQQSDGRSGLDPAGVLAALMVRRSARRRRWPRRRTRRRAPGPGPGAGRRG